MAISVVQTASHSGNPPATFGSAVTAGNTVFLAATGYTTTSGNPSTSAAKLGGSAVTGTVAFFNNGTTGGILSPLSAGNGAYISIWMLPNIPGGGTTVDVTFAGQSGIIGQVAYEVAGLGASPVLDKKTSGGSATGTAVDSGSTGAITGSPEFVLGCSMAFVGISSGPSGFTAVHPAGDMWAGFQIATSSGGSYDWQQTSSGNPWSAGLVTVAASLTPAVSNSGLLMVFP